jgi:hypothetical protein
LAASAVIASVADRMGDGSVGGACIGNDCIGGNKNQ